MTKHGPDPKHVRLSAAGSLASHGLAELSDLAELSERLLKNELDALSARVHEKVSCLPFPENEFEQGWFDDDLYQLAEVFPKIQRYALFITTMGAIEHHLHNMCTVAKKICDQSLSPSDLNGRGIVRSVKYLTKVCGFRISQSTGSQVDNLTMCQKMRNAVVHADGRLSDDDIGAIRQYQKRNPRFEINDRGEIVLSQHFVSTVVHSSKLLFEIIVAEMNKRLKKAQSGHEK